MVAFFHTILYTPIYNLLIFLVGILPGGDVGLAVVIVTLIVKLIVMPLSISALRTQRAMKAVEPELKAIKERLKDNKEEQAKETFALYKKYNINPFASFATMLVQLPVLICLYWVFRTEHLPAVDVSLLYSFVHVPGVISMLFLGFFAVAGHSIILAGVAAVFQFIQARYAIPAPPKAVPGTKPSMQEELGRTMALQARFILPIIIGFIAYASGAIALYFITSNAAGILQEFYVRRTGLRS
jgi:YidC/Oxa1 family membrane protein insertase